MQSLRERRQLKRRQRQAWQATFAGDAVDLRKLPVGVTLKARSILSALASGTDYWQVAGKRLQSARCIVRIPVTRRYRLLCREDNKALTPLKVISHEDYNGLVDGVHRWLKHCLKEQTKNE